MKRHIIRMTALAGVLAIGFIAIAQVQRGDEPSASAIASDTQISLDDRPVSQADQSPDLQATMRSPSRIETRATQQRPPSVLSIQPQQQQPLLLAASNVEKPQKANPLRPYNSETVPAYRQSIERTEVVQTSALETQRGESRVGLLPPPPLATRGDATTSLNNATKPQSQSESAPISQNRDLSSSLPTATAESRMADPFGMQHYDDQNATTSVASTRRSSDAALLPSTLPSISHVTSSVTPAAPSAIPSQLATRANDTPRPFPSNQTASPLSVSGAGADTIGMGPTAIAEGTALPAHDRRLEGVQTPQLSIEKIAPAEIQVDNPTSFRVIVRNTGEIAALNVEVHDNVPKGTRLIEAMPRAVQDADGTLVWNLGRMEPGDEKEVEIRLMPLAEGEIGSVATVRFDAGASVRTLATKPQLRIETSAQQRVLIGEDLRMVIKVSNPGSGVARGVVITEQVPAGLQHSAGAELEYEIGDLRPNESRELELKLAAVRPGKITNVMVARGQGGLQYKQEMPLEVLAPSLKLAISGPKLRFLERETTYKLSVSNPGTAPARDVRLQAQMPEGLRFVSANNNGHYDSQTNSVVWALAELPVGETGAVQLTAMPEKIGEQKLTYRGEAEGALAVEEQKDIIIDGIAAIRFEVVDIEDPVEKGGETAYEIRVVNQGSKAGSNVRVQVDLPPAMRLIDAEGPSRNRPTLMGNTVAFEPIARLSPKVDATYRIRVKCEQAGDQRISVQLQTAEMQTPVTKEESTRVFTDR